MLQNNQYTVSNPGVTTRAAPEAPEAPPVIDSDDQPDHPKPVQKRAPASPATGRDTLPPVEPSPPIKSPDLKKQRMEPNGPNARVEAYVQDVISKAESPMAPMMDLQEDDLDWVHPTPKKLDEQLEAAETVPVALSNNLLANNTLQAIWQFLARKKKTWRCFF